MWYPFLHVAVLVVHSVCKLPLHAVQDDDDPPVSVASLAKLKQAAELDKWVGVKYISLCDCMHVCTYLFMYVCIYVSVNRFYVVCMYVRLYVRMFV